jgi:sec-independent protein translocase protein TatC
MADADALRDSGVPSLLPAPASPDPLVPAPAAPGEKVMTLVDHLSELRHRLVISALAIGAGTVVGFLFAGQLIHTLKAPLGADETLIFLSPGEAFFVNLKLSIIVGIVLAMPVLLYQLWAFISPGLTVQERRAARPWVPVALLFFALGVVVAWFILPYAISFLLSFESADLQAAITADNYFGFVGTLFLAFGLTMEFPIVLVLLSKVGIITSERLRSSRRIVVLGIAIFSAVVTPGGDLVSPVVLGLVMYLLYELSIVLVKAGGR